MSKYRLAQFAEQDRLYRKKLKTAEGKYLRKYLKISKCGIDHHPALPPWMKEKYYPFSSKQDGLEDGLIRVDVPGGPVGADSSHPVTHYLSLDNLEVHEPYTIPIIDITVPR